MCVFRVLRVRVRVPIPVRSRQQAHTHTSRIYAFDQNLYHTSFVCVSVRYFVIFGANALKECVDNNNHTSNKNNMHSKLSRPPRTRATTDFILTRPRVCSHTHTHSHTSSSNRFNLQFAQRARASTQKSGSQPTRGPHVRPAHMQKHVHARTRLDGAGVEKMI